MITPAQSLLWSAGESHADRQANGQGEGVTTLPAALEGHWADQTPAALQDIPPEPTLSDVFKAIQSCNSSLTLLTAQF